MEALDDQRDQYVRSFPDILGDAALGIVRKIRCSAWNRIHGLLKEKTQESGPLSIMPYTYVIDKERRLVMSTVSGIVTFTEIMAHLDQLVREPDFSPEFNHFIDWAAATNLDISTDEAKAIARRRDFSPPSRRAFFTTSPSIYGMLRLILTHHEMAGAREFTCVFYDRDEALKWLGLTSLRDFTEAED
jgi:hypothetical protein